MTEQASGMKKPVLKLNLKVHPPKQGSPAKSASSHVDPNGTRDLLQTLESSIDDLRSLVTCRICLRPLYEPYTIACGHTFCYGCLSQWFVNNRATKTCPDCRHIVTRQPAPAYMVREMTQIFISRAELLPGGETTGDHLKWQKEETELVERDRKNADRMLGGLFRGSFKSQHLNLRAIRDDEDGVERCPDCTWELEDGVCMRCHTRIDNEGIMRHTSEDFSDLDDLSETTGDDSDEEMDVEVDMEDHDQELGFDGLDDGDISLDGDGRPIHRVDDLSDDDFGFGRTGPRDIRGRPRPLYGINGTLVQDPRWITRPGIRSDFLSSGDEGEESGQDGEAGSLNDFIVDDEVERQNQNGSDMSQTEGQRHDRGSSVTTASAIPRNPGRAPQTTSHVWRGRSHRTLDAASQVREFADQHSNEEDSDEGGGISNGRRRVRSEWNLSHERTAPQHMPGGFPHLSDSDNEEGSDGATETLLEAGWSQLGQDDREVDDLEREAVSTSADDRDNDANMGGSDRINFTRLSASSPNNMHRVPSVSTGHWNRARRRHRAHAVDLGSNRPRHPSFERPQRRRERDIPEPNFIQRSNPLSAHHMRHRRESSLPFGGGDAGGWSARLTEEDQDSNPDLAPPVSPLSSSSLMDKLGSEVSAGIESRPDLHRWSQSNQENSESSGSKTPSGLSSRSGNRASSETVTIGRSSSMAGSTAALRPPITYAGAQSPIYINSSPVKSDRTASPIDRAYRFERSVSAVSNPSAHTPHRSNPAAESEPDIYPGGRPRNQLPPAMSRAWNSRRDIQSQSSRPSIRGGGPSTGASLFPHARPFAEVSDEREREQAAEKIADKSARRRAKELRRQNQNPFASAQSRLSQASRLFGQAAERYSGMQGQAGLSFRTGDLGTPDAAAVRGFHSESG
ncbi:MAG: hypothetical protein M1830_008325 [Pleopsidium flavum]|nr:MAG: hypothetical protein M1830_008325 [Pleopsidium flavum]